MRGRAISTLTTAAVGRPRRGSGCASRDAVQEQEAIMPGTVAVAKTLLQFIGLVVLTSKVSNDPGLHAILPRISANAHVPTLTNPNAPIDEHAAVLVFKKSDYVPGS